MDFLSVSNLTKAFGGVHAVDHASFSIQEHNITALIGPNGAGKTTVFGLISGLIPSDTGTIVLQGRDLSNMPARLRSHAGLSRTFQQVRLFKNLTVRDHLFAAFDQTDDLFFKSAFRDDAKELETLAGAILRRVGLDSPLNTGAAELSYGQQKLLDLARALAKPHTLLMLDEPVAGVNPVVREQLKKILLQLKAEGESVLLIEHDMDFVRSVADRVIVMDQGRVLVDGKPQEVLSDRRVLEAYLGA